MDLCDNEDFVWSREDFYNQYDGDERWFIGHTPVQYLEYLQKGMPKGYPYTKGNITFMDTGSFMDNGKISCMEIKSGRVCQSK